MAGWTGGSTRRCRPATVIGAGSVAGRDLPFSGFAVPPEVVEGVGGDARRLFEGVQVNPFRGSYRDEITMFRANEDLPVAVSYAWHNPQFGEGGLRQVYVHEMQSLIERGVLVMVDQAAADQHDGAAPSPVCAAPWTGAERMSADVRVPDRVCPTRTAR